MTLTPNIHLEKSSMSNQIISRSSFCLHYGIEQILLHRHTACFQFRSVRLLKNAFWINFMCFDWWRETWTWNGSRSHFRRQILCYWASGPLAVISYFLPVDLNVMVKGNFFFRSIFSLYCSNAGSICKCKKCILFLHVTCTQIY